MIYTWYIDYLCLKGKTDPRSVRSAWPIDRVVARGETDDLNDLARVSCGGSVSCLSCIYDTITTDVGYIEAGSR